MLFTLIVAVPWLKMDLVRHSVFSRRTALLRECGVHILHEPERYPSPLMVLWLEILATVHEVAQINR